MSENKVKEERSTEWSLSLELAKSNKRMFVILITVIVLWFATIVGFVLYMSQYDYSSYEITTDQGGNAFYGEVGEGDLNYGSNSGEKTGSEESKKF